MFIISTDIPAGVIEVIASGFWSEAEVAELGEALTEAKRRMAAAGRHHDLLCDYTGATIQSQAVIAALQALVHSIEHKSRKIALYTDGLLGRQQARRLASVREDMAVFDDRVSAVEWLLADRVDRHSRAG